MEMYDDLIKAIRIMYKKKGLSLIKYNGIETNDKGQIIAGRFTDFSLITLEDLNSAGIKEMIVIDEPNRKESVRSFVEEKAPKKVIEKTLVDETQKEEKQEEKVTDTQTEIEEKPVKKTRKPRTKKVK